MEYHQTDEIEIWRWESEGGCTGTESQIVLPAKRPRPAIKAFHAIVTAARRCQWPIGDPGDADFRFCDREALAKRPYCAEHSARAYAPTRRTNGAGV